ncbi:unnamed protein product [Absidia cylindrospora]
MAFLSGFVKSGLSLLGKDSNAFPYSLGEKVEFYDHPFWSLHHGTKKEDGSPVSMFVFDCSKHRDRIQMAGNAFKRLRTLRHPDLLKYLDGVENEQAIMFVTDPVEPLSNQLAQDPIKTLSFGVSTKLRMPSNFSTMIALWYMAIFEQALYLQTEPVNGNWVDWNFYLQ